MPRRAGAAKQQHPDAFAGGVAGEGVGAASDDLLVKIRDDFEEFGLNGYQARILLALLRVGSAAPPYLAQLAGVHRTSAYPVLEELRAKGVAQQLPGKAAVWTTLGPGEVLERLLAAQQDRLRAIERKMEETRRALDKVASHSPATPAPYLQLLSSATQARSIYDRLLAESEVEFLVLNRPPYSAATDPTRAERAARDAGGRDEVNPAVIEALRRGVAIRVLYQATQWDAADAGPFREAMGHYHAAGVQGRVVDELPMKLVVSDRRVALLALTDPVLPEVGFPANLHIEHAGYAAFQADAFEHRWATARPATTKAMAQGREPKAEPAPHRDVATTADDVS